MSTQDKKDNPEEMEPIDNSAKSEELEAVDSKAIEFGANPLSISSSESLKIDENDTDILSLKNLGKGKSDKPKETKAGKNVKSATAFDEEKDPIFARLANPKLPNLPRENRARLQMQSPTRIYFYWSIKDNPFQTLNKAFGGRTGSYVLIAKLVNRTNNTEELFPVEAEGNWWFNVDSNSDYRAEIGFYAPNRPYVRIMFSNDIRTPRKSPSKRTDYTPSFNVNAYAFAEVLDVAGYQRDAFEVAVAGDDAEAAENATHQTYAQLVGKDIGKFEQGKGDELRFALLALASGYSLKEVRNEVSAQVFARLQSDLTDLSPEKILAALKDNFDIFTDEVFEEEEIGSAIFGASLVNFPTRIKRRNVPKTLLPKLSRLSNPDSVSSFGLK